MAAVAKTLEEIKLGDFVDIEKLDLKKLDEMIKLAEQAERYQDMVEFVKKLVERKNKENGKEERTLSGDERNLLSVADKTVEGQKRSAWRVLKEGTDQADVNEKIKQAYTNRVTAELRSMCNEVLAILNDLSERSKHLTTVDRYTSDAEFKKTINEDRVFYMKMIGDYYRYLKEVFENDEDLKTKCSDSYGEAMKLAEEHLASTNATRLGLALNFSVCYYEIMGEKQKACDLAKKAFDDAIEKLDSLNDASYKDSTLIMQLLRDNLTIWTSDADQDQGDQAEEAG